MLFAKDACVACQQEFLFIIKLGFVYKLFDYVPGCIVLSLHNSTVLYSRISRIYFYRCNTVMI